MPLPIPLALFLVVCESVIVHTCCAEVCRLCAAGVSFKGSHIFFVGVRRFLKAQKFHLTISHNAFLIVDVREEAHSQNVLANRVARAYSFRRTRRRFLVIHLFQDATTLCACALMLINFILCGDSRGLCGHLITLSLGLDWKKAECCPADFGCLFHLLLP